MDVLTVLLVSAVHAALASSNEVSCTARGNDLGILLNPPEIQTHQPDQLIKEINGTDEVTVKGQYLDITINPTCEFWLEREKKKKRLVHESANHLAEDADKKFVSTQCRASGRKKFLITWHNEGEPVSREDTTNTTGNLITVTSTLIHTASSLPDNHRCNITHEGLPLTADPEKTDIKEITSGSVNKEINEVQQQHCLIRLVIVISAGAFFLVVILILFCYKVLKRTKVKTPKKPSNVENVPLISRSSTGRESMNEGTPRNESPREITGSSIKKRTKLNSPGKLNMSDIHNERVCRTLHFKE